MDLWNKLFGRPRAQIILISTALLILGTLCGRASVPLGHWITLAGLGFYLAAFFPSTVRRMFVLRKLTARERVHLLLYLIVLYLTVRLAVTGNTGYFTVLIAWAVDYLLSGKEG